jgi:hypothetical protein
MTIAELVQRTRVSQGLPPTITDAATLARIAALVAPSTTETGSRRGAAG